MRLPRKSLSVVAGLASAMVVIGHVAGESLTAQDPSTAPISKQEISTTHPWLVDVPPSFSRLVDLGRVRMEVDEAAVRKAGRTALTAFQFQFRYRIRYRPSELSKKGSTPESTRLWVRFVEADWNVEHRILLSDRFNPSKPWETALLRHEFDHIAVSTDPRLSAMMHSLRKSEVELSIALQPGERLSAERIQGEVQDYVVRFQKALEALVNENYKRLDAVSNNGLSTIPERADFFLKLYDRERLEREQFEFFELVEQTLRSVKQVDIDRHYALR